MDIQWRPVPFLAPMFTTVTAPIVRAIGRALADTILAARAAEIECPRCRDVIALWSPQTGFLHFPSRGGIGLPLSEDRTASVDICCIRCDKTRATISGRAVARNLHNGRPPLA